MPRVVAIALRAAADEIRADLRAGASWADAHLTGATRERLAVVTVDTSLGFDEERHPHREKSRAPCTTIFVEARRAS
jgi:hypothetical protein